MDISVASSNDGQHRSPDAVSADPEEVPETRPALGDREHVAQSFQDWIGGARLPRWAHLVVGLFMPATVLAGAMWRVRAFTIDDSYISYRYARNLARGLGLVYNEGERIEGYTNFLWTVILAAGIRVGIDPDVLAKVLGAASAIGVIAATHELAGRLRPLTVLPCVATWLLASTVVLSGYAVFGLETAFFVFLVLAGLALFFRETEDGGEGGAGREALPWSGLVFALAGLTRPEAPMFLGIPMLLLGRRFFGRQNLVRAALFVVPVAAHLLWRRAYYGAWLPNTLGAKTGDLRFQAEMGWAYVRNYMVAAGPAIYFALLPAARAVLYRRRELATIAMLCVAVAGYVVLVGGDWMPQFRFMAPFEPFCFLLVDAGARAVFERRGRATKLALAAFALVVAIQRGTTLREAQRHLMEKDHRFWRTAAGGTADWLIKNGERGEIAIGDIGYVGWATDYPVLDLLGLVDPVISKLPGGYTHKLGPGFLQRFFDKAPKYFLLISSSLDCQHPSVPGSQVIYYDRRFRERYELGGRVPLDGGFAWCIYQRRR